MSNETESRPVKISTKQLLRLETANNVQHAIGEVARLCSKVFAHPTSDKTWNQYVQSIEALLECLHRESFRRSPDPKPTRRKGASHV